MWTECLFHWDTSENAPNPCPSLLPPQLPRRLHWFKLIVTYFHQTSSAECKFIPYPHFITDSLIQLPASLPPPPLPRQPIHPLLPKHHISKAHNYRAPAEVQKKKIKNNVTDKFLFWPGWAAVVLLHVLAGVAVPAGGCACRCLASNRSALETKSKTSHPVPSLLSAETQSQNHHCILPFSPEFS